MQVISYSRRTCCYFLVYADKEDKRSTSGLGERDACMGFLWGISVSEQTNRGCGSDLLDLGLSQRSVRLLLVPYFIKYIEMPRGIDAQFDNTCIASPK